MSEIAQLLALHKQLVSARDAIKEKANLYIDEATIRSGADNRAQYYVDLRTHLGDFFDSLRQATNLGVSDPKRANANNPYAEVAQNIQPAQMLTGGFRDSTMGFSAGSQLDSTPIRAFDREAKFDTNLDLRAARQLQLRAKACLADSSLNAKDRDELKKMLKEEGSFIALVEHTQEQAEAIDRHYFAKFKSSSLIGFDKGSHYDEKNDGVLEWMRRVILYLGFEHSRQSLSVNFDQEKNAANVQVLRMPIYSESGVALAAATMLAAFMDETIENKSVKQKQETGETDAEGNPIVKEIDIPLTNLDVRNQAFDGTFYIHSIPTGHTDDAIRFIAAAEAAAELMSPPGHPLKISYDRSKLAEQFRHAGQQTLFLHDMQNKLSKEKLRQSKILQENIANDRTITRAKPTEGPLATADYYATKLLHGGKISKLAAGVPMYQAMQERFMRNPSQDAKAATMSSSPPTDPATLTANASPSTDSPAAGAAAQPGLTSTSTRTPTTTPTGTPAAAVNLGATGGASGSSATPSVSSATSDTAASLRVVDTQGKLKTALEERKETTAKDPETAAKLTVENTKPAGPGG